MKRLTLALFCAALVAVAAITVTARSADYAIARRAVISCSDHADAPYLYYNVTDQLWHCGTAAPTGTSLVTTPLPVANGGTAIASYTVGNLIYASGATTLSKLADVAAGSYLRSGGVSTAPLWSTLVLPNAATTGDVFIASSANTMGRLADVATGQVLVSGGVSTAPAFSATPTVTSLTATTVTAPTLALTATVTWTSGAGAPSAGACTSGTLGSLYSNTSGGTSTTLYVCTAAGTWTAK